MAVMRKEPKDIAELGPIGIIREALKLYAAHIRVYTLIQLGLMLPLAILLLVAEYFFVLQFSPLPPGAPRFLRALRSFGDVELDHKGQMELMLVAIAGFLVFQVAVNLSLSTTLYTVGLHYAGQPVSFIDAVRAATPWLWARLVLTTLCVNVLSWLIAFVQAFGSVLLQYALQSVSEYSGVVRVLSWVASLGLGIILMISSGVSVLEQDYGWAAIKKGLKLLKGKANVAILFQLIWIVPSIIELGCGAAFAFQVTKGDFYANFSPSALVLLSFTVVVLLAWTTFFWEMQILCAGVQYVSFKAYHDESLSDSLYEKRTILVERYESFGDESKVPLLNGALLKGNVV